MKKKLNQCLVKKNGLNKLINVIRLSIFIQFFSLSQAFAVGSFSQPTKLSLDMRNTGIEDVNNGSLIAVENEYISQQQKSISGKVTDASGATLPGVSVVVKGTTSGVITDMEGKFSLSNIPDNATLQFSFVGMKGQEIVIAGKTTINVTLSDDAIGIEEVVAIGYGTMKKSDLAGAVASVKGDDLGNTQANTIVQTLQGRISGVDIKSASNAPGGDVRIRIRGSNSINASSEPLYVIDGFPIDNNNTAPQGAGNNAFSPSPLSSISPNEIESVEILKDASATAIYGSRGANGVVLITTKNGKAGKVKVDFDYSLNVASVRKKRARVPIRQE